MRTISPLLALAFALGPASALAAKPSKDKGTPPGLAKTEGIPPRQANETALPPGLAKKHGAQPPGTVYIAFDRRYEDRAWFLVGKERVLRSGFEPSVHVEAKASGPASSPRAPPIPLPKVAVDPHVFLFQ